MNEYIIIATIFTTYNDSIYCRIIEFDKDGVKIIEIIGDWLGGRDFYRWNDIRFIIPERNTK